MNLAQFDTGIYILNVTRIKKVPALYVSHTNRRKANDDDDVDDQDEGPVAEERPAEHGSSLKLLLIAGMPPEPEGGCSELGDRHLGGCFSATC